MALTLPTLTILPGFYPAVYRAAVHRPGCSSRTSHFLKSRNPSCTTFRGRSTGSVPKLQKPVIPTTSSSINILTDHVLTTKKLNRPFFSHIEPGDRPLPKRPHICSASSFFNPSGHHFQNTTSLNCCSFRQTKHYLP